MEEYLVHHGIKGQRWGIRRYQREDGTRTTLGKKHEAKLAPYNASKNLENKAHTGTTLGKKQEAKLAPYNMLENGQYYVRTAKTR